MIRVDAPRGTRIQVDALPEKLEAQRVLFATGRFPDPNDFNRDFVALEPALVDELHGRGVKLVGLDTPSVDLFDSKELPAHNAVATPRSEGGSKSPWTGAHSRWDG